MHDPAEQRDRILREALACRLQLIAYARSLLGDYAAADDVVQEAMLVVARKFDQFEVGTSMLAWCRSIVRLEVLRSRREARREFSLSDRLLSDAIDAAFDECLPRQSDNSAWHDALEQCLHRVTDRGRRVLNARFAEELSYQQIADRLNMSLEGVRKTLFRVKQQVRSCVEMRLRSAT